MKDKALEAVSQFQMLGEGDRVAVGVSGGADSVALLDFLLLLRPSLGLEMVVCHVNHHLRGQESDRDEAFVRALAQEHGLSFELLSIDATALAAQQGQSVEAASRDARYAFFEQVACGGKIATAHTASDSLETVLFNLARGTGLAGLCGIPPVRGAIIRPLILCTRQQVEQYCRERGLSYVTDSTNLSDDYSRNLIRHHVIPQLQKLNPGAQGAAAGMCSRLRQDEAYLNETATQEAGRISVGELVYDRAAFLRLHPAISGRIIKQLLEQVGVDPSARFIALAQQTAQSGSGRVEVAKGTYLFARETTFGLEREEPVLEYFQHTVVLPQEGSSTYMTIHGTVIELSNKKIANYKNVHNSLLKNSVDYDKISGNVFFRQKQDGDRITLPARGITKSLKKLFQEQRLTPYERATRLVAADSKGILWVQGAGVDSRVFPGPETKQLLQFQIQKAFTEVKRNEK